MAVSVALAQCVASVEGSQCDYLPLKLLLKALVTQVGILSHEGEAVFKVTDNALHNH